MNPKTITQRPSTTRGLIYGVFLLTVLFTGAHFLSFLGAQPVDSVAVEEEERVDPFANISLEATSVYVYDVRTNTVLFEKNAHTPLPLASVTKVMTGLAATRLAHAHTSITIRSEHLAPEGDSGLLVGEKWAFADLRDFTLVSSSNDGASALAALGALNTPQEEDTAHPFVSFMNDIATELGLTQTYYLNPSGLDESEGIPGGYGSARDMAHLFAHILTNTPDTLTATAAPSLQFSSDVAAHEAENTNAVAERIPGLIASKTGFTDLAGGNLVIAFDAGIDRPIVVSVLGSGREARFEDVTRLVWASVAAIGQN